ncbi:hypothetical protein N0V88_006783 [Collariella sp. IMI 366227]|nr:hypothetical protein N0V88_006783 [Collariella sp. IMI 366227]
MYRKSQWNVDAVPNADMSLTSYIFSVRLAATKLRLDPSTERPRLEDTPLIKRTLTYWSEEQPLAMCSNGKERRVTELASARKHNARQFDLGGRDLL